MRAAGTARWVACRLRRKLAHRRISTRRRGTGARQYVERLQDESTQATDSSCNQTDAGCREPATTAPRVSRCLANTPSVDPAHLATIYAQTLCRGDAVIDLDDSVRRGAVGELADEIKHLRAILKMVSRFVAIEASDDLAVIAAGTMLGPIADALVLIGLLERLPDGNVRLACEENQPC